MRILWFTNVPLPAVRKHQRMDSRGVGGHWMSALLENFREQADLKLGIATAFPGLQDASFTEDGVEYFVVSQPRRRSAFSCNEADLKSIQNVVNKFKPDLIHVHGTERFFGLLKSRGMTAIPMAVSIQGLLGPYSTYQNYFGALTPLGVLKSTRILELLIGIGLLWDFRSIRKGAVREADILSSADAFFGRTSWDRACTVWRNPSASYHHVGEVLRPEFSKCQWDISAARRHSIIFTNAGHPRRGSETLLKAVSILRNDFPDVELKLAGYISTRSGYGRSLRRAIKTNGLEQCTKLLGVLDETRMAKELLGSHVFAITSFIENSPNSLAEAMQVGIPCVGSYTGGIPDMIEDGVTGSLFPCGDSELLAYRISRIFRDDKYACSIGAAAHSSALQRHAPENVVTQLLSAYQMILEN